MLIVRFVLIFSYNLDLDGAEFTFVHYIQQLLQGLPLYLNPEVHPYSTVLYTPLNLYTVFAICKWLGFNYIYDVHAIYIVGRCVSFLCVIGTIWYIDLIVKIYSKDKTIRLQSIFIFLLIISGHAYAFRPDSMKILFFVQFVYYFIQYFFYAQRKLDLFCMILFANLSFLAKQDVVVYVMLVLVINFLFQRNLKSVFVVAVTAITFAINIFILYLVLGEYCLVHLFSFNLQVISNIESSYNLLVALLNTTRLLPIYCLLIYNLYKIKNGNNATFLKSIIITSLAANVIAVVFLFRPGSYLNYTYEASFLLMFTLFLVLFFKPVSIQMKYSIVLYFAFYFLSNLAIKNYVVLPEKEIKYKNEYSSYLSLRKQVLPLMKKQTCLYAPNLKLSIFFADRNVIYGQEYHLDRLIYANLGLKSCSRLKINSSNSYDENFQKGNVDYILAFDKETEIKVIETYYTKYLLQQKFNQFLLYKFQNE